MLRITNIRLESGTIWWRKFSFIFSFNFFLIIKVIYAYYRKSGKVQKSIKKRIIDNQGENNINFNCQGGKKVTHFSFFSLKGKGKGKPLSGVRLFTTPWTAAYQAPLSMGFSRQEYWSGVPSPSPISVYMSL